jgi:hypothetical protein
MPEKRNLLLAFLLIYKAPANYVERLHDQNFNMVEFHHIRLEAETNRFTLSVFQWVEKTKAIGILSKSGRYRGTWLNNAERHCDDF